MLKNLKESEVFLAENKVYDSWPYLKSLSEVISYMQISSATIKSVYKKRGSDIKESEKKIINRLYTNGEVAITVNDLPQTVLDIAGVKISDSIYLKKAVIEFFHYSRVCIDLLFQVLNTTLLRENSFDNEDNLLIQNVTKKLQENQEFSNINCYITDNKYNEKYNYIREFDNYTKHNKNIPVIIENSFLCGENEEFKLAGFKEYPAENVLSKVQELEEYVLSVVDNILTEVKRCIPLYTENSRRVQDVYLDVIGNKNGMIESFCYYIIVENDLSSLEDIIEILPVTVRGGQVEVNNLNVDTIFISNDSNNKNVSVIGKAVLINQKYGDNEYRKYRVERCTIADQYNFHSTCKEKYKGKITTAGFKVYTVNQRK